MVSENIIDKRIKKTTQNKKYEKNKLINGAFLSIKECYDPEEEEEHKKVELFVNEHRSFLFRYAFNPSENPKDYNEEDIKKIILMMDAIKLENPEFERTDETLIKLYYNCKHQQNEF